MRKVDDGKRKEKEKKKKKKITAEIVATNVVASRPPNGDRLQRRPLVPIKSTPSQAWGLELDNIYTESRRNNYTSQLKDFKILLLLVSLNYEIAKAAKLSK